MYSASTRGVSKALRYSTHCQEMTQFYLHITVRIIRKLTDDAVDDDDDADDDDDDDGCVERNSCCRMIVLGV